MQKTWTQNSELLVQKDVFTFELEDTKETPEEFYELSNESSIISFHEPTEEIIIEEEETPDVTNDEIPDRENSYDETPERRRRGGEANQRPE
ncbi:unnamed protein product [Leptidea sinapis]|uniref:Uncharacterized protein n=1 Tax=Leptidea sinapis TaxID=189913 RepID=A0A5E4QNF6_9NEOP|nr:unnamed protein product [Leptidea sinapis]